jgi:hypothetical protein
MCTSSNYQPQPVSPVSATVQPSVGGAETKPGLTPLVVLPGLTANGQGIPLRNFEGANDEPVDFFWDHIFRKTIGINECCRISG